MSILIPYHPSQYYQYYSMQCNSTRSRRIAKQYNYCFILQNIKSIINKKHVLPNKTKTNYQVNQVSSRSNNIERRVISSYLWEGIVSKVSLGRRCCLCEQRRVRPRFSLPSFYQVRPSKFSSCVCVCVCVCQVCQQVCQGSSQGQDSRHRYFLSAIQGT